MAKALALGASLCGLALPLLRPAMESEEALFARIEELHRELQTAMFLCGAAKTGDMKRTRMYITGKTREMIGQIRGG